MFAGTIIIFGRLRNYLLFAQLLNVNVSAVRGWEQGIRSPNGASQRLLGIAEREPEVLPRDAGPVWHVGSLPTPLGDRIGVRANEERRWAALQRTAGANDWHQQVYSSLPGRLTDAWHRSTTRTRRSTEGVTPNLVR